MTHAGHAWAPIGTPGRCLEGVTPGSAGIFSALIYFVAETPIIFYVVFGLPQQQGKLSAEKIPAEQ